MPSHTTPQQPMLTTLRPTLPQLELTPNSALLLRGLSWADYLQLLQALGDDRPTRCTFSQSCLELRMPSRHHEIVNRLLAKIVVALVEEWGGNVRDLGSSTWNQPQFAQGAEPDSCFYIQNADRIQGLNPQIPDNLPPDLIIEVDIASSCQRRLPLYAALGVPEIWLYQGSNLAEGTIVILGLGHEATAPSPATYSPQPASLAFPALSPQQLQAWVQQGAEQGDIPLLRQVRQFCRQTP